MKQHCLCNKYHACLRCNYLFDDFTKHDCGSYSFKDCDRKKEEGTCEEVCLLYLARIVYEEEHNGLC